MIGPAMLLTLAAATLAAPPADPLATLRAGHPRLILLDEDLPRLRQAVQADPTAKAWHEQLRAEAEKLLTTPVTEYKIVGPRLLGASRSVLRRVQVLGLLYRLDGDERFGHRAVEELKAAAAWPQWNPSHFLDVAELNQAFGVGYDWLQPVLGTDKDAIRDALITKGLTPAVQGYRNKAWWVTVHHNWNQVCNGGNSLGALAVADEQPELAREILTAAVANLPAAIRSYAPDGGWAEGPGYWHYATTYTIDCLAGLQTALGTDFGLSDIAGLEHAGMFRVYFAGPSGQSFNYADAGAGTPFAPELFWLAKRYGQPVYAWAERQAKKPGGYDLAWFSTEGQDPKATGLPLDRLFRGVDVAFLRGDWLDPNTTWVGFHAGDNRANHSHLDLGTFVLDALGERWIDCLGPDNYNLPGYFGKQRWDYYRLNTHGQNALVIHGGNQDAKAKATIAAFGSTPDRAFAVADLTAAWPVTKRVRRGVALLHRRDVLVVDEVSADTPVTVEWGVHTHAAVEAKDTEATLTLHGKTLHAKLLSPAGARFEVRSAHQEPPQAKNDGISKLVVVLPDKVKDLCLAVQFSPAANAPTPAVEPLEAWRGAGG